MILLLERLKTVVGHVLFDINREAARRCRDRRRKLIDTLQKDNRQLRDTLSQIAVAIKEHHSQTGCSTLRLDIEHISSLISKSNTTSSGSKSESFEILSYETELLMNYVYQKLLNHLDQMIIRVVM